jgi:hypothetical protein
VDSIYAAAAKEPHGLEPVATMLFFVVLFGGMSIACNYVAGPMPPVNQPEFSLRAKIGKIGPRLKVSYKLLAIFSFVTTLIVLMCFPLDMMSRDVREEFNRKMVYYGPWLCTSDEKRLRSEFIAMDTEKEYRAIMDEMQGSARKNGFPKFPVPSQ